MEMASASCFTLILVEETASFSGCADLTRAELMHAGCSHAWDVLASKGAPNVVNKVNRAETCARVSTVTVSILMQVCAVGGYAIKGT